MVLSAPVPRIVLTSTPMDEVLPNNPGTDPVPMESPIIDQIVDQPSIAVSVGGWSVLSVNFMISPSDHQQLVDWSSRYEIPLPLREDTVELLQRNVAPVAPFAVDHPLVPYDSSHEDDKVDEPFKWHTLESALRKGKKTLFDGQGHSFGIKRTYKTTNSISWRCTCRSGKDWCRATVPLAFILMSNKKKRDYTAVFEHILSLIMETENNYPNVEEVVSDFEKAVWGSIKNLLPGKKSKKKFNATVEEVSKMRDNALLKNFCSYIERTWITSTVWPPKSWSMFNEHRRTNNNAEGYHNHLKLEVASNSPNLMKFIFKGGQDQP
ncbi:hypothetical protein DAPPUDRAFT_256316 [Daphnia pulex]|uniref:MULE transposase domain-containing protein n=1 Tax=Daphnia pulex TaxID=6669 RepID=E9HB37_DAPPU|nr:hypothetical protein DAPPUDRAFT_256316 [Daphnia pulex]|eukprot:EFX71017.1 hypothetical protein DAPPUDRAFT_256316 [Daphnia pulex]